MPVRGKITALAAGAAVATCGVPAPASAAEPGFTVDPQSPAGVEYQVPLDSARGQGGGGHHGGHHGGGSAGGGDASGGGGGSASSGGGTSGSSTGSSTLFGAGIAPAVGRASGSHGGSPGAGGGTGTAGARASGSGGGSSDRSLGAALTASTEDSGTGPLTGIIVAILLAGGGLGLFLRLRARRPRKIFS
jgi:hypothetical protein